MLVKSDAKQEKDIVEKMIAEDETLKKQHEDFLKEMAFKQEQIDSRK